MGSIWAVVFDAGTAPSDIRIIAEFTTIHPTLPLLIMVLAEPFRVVPAITIGDGAFFHHDHNHYATAGLDIFKLPSLVAIRILFDVYVFRKPIHFA